MLYVIIILVNTYSAYANPVNLEARANSDGSSGGSFITPKAWIPVVVVILLLCIVALMTWSKNSMKKVFSFFGRALGLSNAGASSSSDTASAPRQLTTEELVGSTTDLPASRPARRNRRPRRTPSQMSVTSLPAYNKEPGAEELVIIRGRDMEDEPMLGSTVVEEDDDHSRGSRYSAVPTSDLPILHSDGPSGDISSQTLRPSFDNQETSSLLRADGREPSGQAPPYFEAIDHTLEHDHEVPTTHTLPSSSLSSSPEPQPRQRKGSGFLSFLKPMMSYASMHRRMESASSSHSREHLNPNHRPSSSISSFRPISDQNSSTTGGNSSRLNSPSLISLTPISAPLSHTLVRTEFTYPKSGPTPEQLKVISSRENFSRFGVPYGPDAIAFAASSSRQELGPPPPDFEASSSSRLPDAADAAGAVDSEEGRSSISESTETEHATFSSDTQSENASINTSILPHTEPPTSSSSKDPNPISPVDPSPSSSSSSTSIPPTLPVLSPISVISEFGIISPTSPTPQHATTNSESGASQYSFQSYATAVETLPRERMGEYSRSVDENSRSSTPRVG